MPALSVGIISVVSGFVGGVISQFAKYFVDYLWSTDCFLRQQVQQYMVADEPIELDQKDIIPDQPLIDKMVKRMSGRSVGMFIFASPAGTGKSTFIKMALQSIKINKKLGMNLKLIKNGGSVLQNQKLHESLKIPSNRSLSDYLPSNSLIILDQVDFTGNDLSNSLRNYITELATDCSNSQKFKIVICVSDALIAKAILSCNGFEKIQLLCPFRSLIWSDDQLDKFIGVKLPNMLPDQIERIRQLVRSCKNSPGLVVKTASLVEDRGLPDEEWEVLNKYSIRCKKSWEEFERT